MNICLFEDSKFDHFYPLSLTRPVYDLRTGCFSMSERIARQMPRANYYFHCRKYLRPLLKQENRKQITSLHQSESCLFINGRLLLTQPIIKKIIALKQNTVVRHKGDIVAAHIPSDKFSQLSFEDSFLIKTQSGLKKTELKCMLIDYIWDCIQHNEKHISIDAMQFPLGTLQSKYNQGVYITNKKNIFIDKKTVIKPGVVIDADKGPVIIGHDVTILSNAVIIGPAYIGSGSTIKAGAKIYPGTTIGPVCKIGGEVEESIVHGYSNKQHDGFLGHAYLGSWCNLGADTNNSDLKNNYSTIKISLDGKKQIDTKMQFLGLLMGDHSKTGINTMFNTGTFVGMGCNIFGAGYVPKFIPSFTWYNADDKPQTYDLNKFISTSRSVCKRRGKRYTVADIGIAQYIYSITKIDLSS